MDPLSATLVVVNLLAFVDNVFRGINIIRKSTEDPRADALYVRLITEQARYAEWKRRMGVETREDAETLMEKLPPNARDSLLPILQPMSKYMADTEKLFVKYGVETPGEYLQGKNTPRKILRRIEFARDGRRQLTDLLDTLKNCNDGLLTIAPPAPGYYVSISGQDPILETSQSQPNPNHSFDAIRQPQPVSAVRASSRVQARSSRVNAQNSQTQPSPTNKIQERIVFTPVIQLLHSTCLDTLRTLISRHPGQKATIEPVADRLGLWASGMVDGRITIDQTLNQKSEAIRLLRGNILGILGDLTITLVHTLSALGEPENSVPILKLKELFTYPEISTLPLADYALDYVVDDDDDLQQDQITYCSVELSELTECLFCTLPTVEFLFKSLLQVQKQNPVLEEREMTLMKSRSEISLSKLKSEPVKELLEIDLELIASMQESLKDTKYVKHMEHKNPRFDARKMLEEVSEEGRQLKYWASRLEDTPGEPAMTTETRGAMMTNLARIAQVYQAGYDPPKDSKRKIDPQKVQAIIDKYVVGYDSSYSDRKSLGPDEAVALDTFHTEVPGELGFKKGDVVTVVKRTQDAADWWTGRIGNREGIFPSKYLDFAAKEPQLLKDSGELELPADFDLLETPPNSIPVVGTRNWDQPSNLDVDEPSAKFEVLRSSTSNIRKLAGSKSPDMKYQSDFSFRNGKMVRNRQRDESIDKLAKENQREIKRDRERLRSTAVADRY